LIHQEVATVVIINCLIFTIPVLELLYYLLRNLKKNTNPRNSHGHLRALLRKLEDAWGIKKVHRHEARVAGRMAIVE